MHITIICTSNKDRSPRLQSELQKKFPSYVIKSAGINKYFTEKHGTKLVDIVDLLTADVIIYCEEVHRRIVFEQFKPHVENKPYVVLNLGDNMDMDIFFEKALKTLSIFNH